MSDFFLKDGDWYRHRLTGDLYRVARRSETGALAFRRDVPGQEVWAGAAKYGMFIKDDSATKMLDSQKAEVAYGAHHVLMAKTNPGGGVPSWINLPSHEKAKWIRGNPPIDGLALAIYESIMEHLKEL